MAVWGPAGRPTGSEEHKPAPIVITHSKWHVPILYVPLYAWGDYGKRDSNACWRSLFTPAGVCQLPSVSWVQCFAYLGDKTHILGLNLSCKKLISIKPLTIEWRYKMASGFTTSWRCNGVWKTYRRFHSLKFYAVTYYLTNWFLKSANHRRFNIVSF